MTILPTSKKSHSSNVKPERFANIRGSSSGILDHPHHAHHRRYGGMSPSAHTAPSNSNIDVTSGAMSTSGVLHSSAVPGAVSNGAALAPVSIVKRRKHSTVTSPAVVIGGASPTVAASAATITASAAAINAGAVSSSATITPSAVSGSISPNPHGKLEKNLLTGSTAGVLKQRHKATAGSSLASSSKQKLSSVPKKEETCNSDDEYGAGFRDDELELRFAERLKKARGLIIKDVKGDGACMFRAVADQVYGDEEMHVDVRTLCMDYIAKNRDHFSQFLTEDFDEYLARKRETDAHGNHVELQAISEIFLRPIEIYEYSIDPINTFHPISPEANTGVVNPPLRISYHGTMHYNSVIDPFRATIGVGLGLPDFKPGMADKNLMNEAKLASEAHHIEEAMLNDKLRMTDWERTDDELSKQIAKESYMEYLRQLERGKGGTEKKVAKTNQQHAHSHHLHKNSQGGANHGVRQSGGSSSLISTVTMQQTNLSFHQQGSGGNENEVTLPEFAGSTAAKKALEADLNEEEWKSSSNATKAKQSSIPVSGSDSSSRKTSMATKRGASSPNILSCSRASPNRNSIERDDAGDGFSRGRSAESCGSVAVRRGSASPLAKIYRDERCCSSSLPNIDSTGFGASFFHTNFDLMKPSTSAASLSRSAGSGSSRLLSEIPSTSSSSLNKACIESSTAGPSSSVTQVVSTSGGGLYEELLAASAMVSDDWASSESILDETAAIARVLALSQQEFYESMRGKSDHQ